MTSEPLRFRRAWVDPTVRPRPVAWFQLHAPGTGRMLGMFFSLPEARAWIRRRPPAERFKLVLYLNGAARAWWLCRAAYGGQIKGAGGFFGGGGKNHGERA